MIRVQNIQKKAVKVMKRLVILPYKKKTEGAMFVPKLGFIHITVPQILERLQWWRFSSQGVPWSWVATVVTSCTRDFICVKSFFLVLSYTETTFSGLSSLQRRLSKCNWTRQQMSSSRKLFNLSQERLDQTTPWGPFQHGQSALLCDDSKNTSTIQWIPPFQQ